MNGSGVAWNEGGPHAGLARRLLAGLRWRVFFLAALLAVTIDLFEALNFAAVAAPLVWQNGPGYRSASLPVPPSGKTGFMKLDGASTGITFTNQLSDERSITNRNLLSGSGVAAGDIDGDGLCDLYFCGLENANVLYRNLGNWKFQDITVEAGVACPNQDSTGATFADIDGDSDLDLLVNSLGSGTRIFENDGKGHFKEITTQAGVASKTGSMSMALGDVDGDGDLDLYVANFRPTTIKDRPQAKFLFQMIDGRPATAPDLTNRFVRSSGKRFGIRPA